MVDALIDGWCERRALKPLRYVLPHWPTNGLTDGVQEAWTAFRHVRAMCRDELQEHGEYETVGAIIATLSGGPPAHDS